MLEAILISMVGVSDWLLDASRALDSLGSAYAAMAQQHTIPPHQRTGLRKKAIETYHKASINLDTAALRKRPDYSRLRAQILSNLAATLIEDQKPDDATHVLSKHAPRHIEERRVRYLGLEPGVGPD